MEIAKRGNMESSGLSFYLVTVMAVLLFKLSVLLVGYLISKLGYELLIKVISGEFKFKANGQRSKADVASASFSIFFIFLGAALIFIAVFKDKPFDTIVTDQTSPPMRGKIEFKIDKTEKPELLKHAPNKANHQ